jgi:hypothetical protein
MYEFGSFHTAMDLRSGGAISLMDEAIGPPGSVL